MTNIDLINAIENVRCLRAEVAHLRNGWMKTGNSDNPDWIVGYENFKLAEQRLNDAQRQLADCMIALQDGYDLALLPKAQVKNGS